MASSQVEFSSSSSPFGCVLRDHNRRREPSVTATHVARFRNNLKTLVMDRLNDCITITPNQNTNPVLTNFPVTKTNHDTSTKRSDDSQQHASTNDPQTQTTSTPAPPIPETSPNKNQTSKLGASSLVQIWEKRLNVSSSNIGLNANANANTAVCSTKQETEAEQEQEQACSVEAGDFEDERYDAGPGSDDGFADWHSSRTSSSSPPSSTQSQSSDAGERERVRVVDIIRRLTLTAAKPPHSSWVEDHNDQPNESSSLHPTLIPKDQVEPKCLSHILCSPRIRGRQAFADLLLQIERDRQRELDVLVERRAVSKFPQRGRIQSLLRLKILKRGMALEDEQKRPQFVITPRENHRSFTIMHLRERFSGVGENGAKSPRGEMLNDNDDDKTQPDTNANTHTPPHVINTNEKDKDNDNQQVVGIHSNNTDNDQIIGGFKEEQIEKQEQKPDQELEPEQGGEVDPPSLEGIWQDGSKLNSDSHDSMNGWEAEYQSEAGEESYGADYVGTSYDWFADISRPRSYWEDRRQSWYQQMLDSNSANDEIRQLIQRKTVSNFLSSDFRERMDKLMVTRLERQTQQEEEYNEVKEDDDVDEELWCFSEGHTQPKSSDNEEEDDDERSLITAQYHEASDYLDQSASPLQLASPSILSSWSYDMGEDSNRGTSISSPQPLLPQFSSNNNQHRPSLVSASHNPSIEMELIYDLRGHMEQLYREMSELRKSIKCCMDMQLMLQHSIKRSHEVGGRKSKKDKSRKPKCCICYNMEIDSLLYRCGHMCSCMKCGKELQWRGGKCPVCRAPIEDVVQASLSAHS
ncbi:hypothetical protein IC582_017607 [Cucumis melo]|uniref:Uncharacterized protein LOC103484234 n=1 Tax=Cucumis melo TaxID=3656 RepID=A0A1S3AYB9_CUCME|nr:uncharacterized protein LOC103484234 [Cucumis melo]